MAKTIIKKGQKLAGGRQYNGDKMIPKGKKKKP
jgi:hypothetical protein